MDLKKYKECLENLNQDDLNELKGIIFRYRDIIILGNGGSNAISQHISEDYTKVLNKRAVCFGDSARMSCYANDYGWENSYKMFLEQFADINTLVILISSSGNSSNIVNAASFCKENKISMITMSGFSPSNRLKTEFNDESLLHFWVDSDDYGIVECLHELILHSII